MSWTQDNAWQRGNAQLSLVIVVSRTNRSLPAEAQTGDMACLSSHSRKEADEI